MNKKEIVFFFSVFFCIVLIQGVSALGLSPAKESIKFEPGLTKEITFHVTNGDSSKEIEIYTEGDLGKYITVDKDILPPGGGSFTATIKLPQKIEKPGKNTGYIVIKEKKNKQKDLIGVLTSIRAPIYVDVPYPGEYIEISSFSIPSINLGYPVEVNIALENKGSKNLQVKSNVDIYFNDEKVKTIEFEEMEIRVQEKVQLFDIFNSTDYRPGKYRANLTVDFGNKVFAQTEFKIGHLSVKILNYTQESPIGGTRPFIIKAENEWGEDIENAYAEVVIINNTGTLEQLAKFKTYPNSISAWKEAKIMGFFEADNFNPGETYPVYMTLFYFGQGQSGHSDPKKGNIRFYEAVEKEQFLNKERVLTLLVIILSMLVIAISISYIWKKK